MIWLAAACALGLPIGLLLIGRVPRCRAHHQESNEAVSVIVPARNEEHRLPHLLHSIRRSQYRPAEILVVDDSSTDSTAAIARALGATVITGQPLPPGWTGKTWACVQGYENAAADWLLFLDADTYLAREGFQRICAAFNAIGDPCVAFSLLPFHETRRPYEDLSLFFHLMMAIGAGGFGWIGKPRLFGHSLLITRELYQACGGHGAVRAAILENFSLAAKIQSAGGRCVTAAGREVLNMRMFPGGIGQLCEGWTKAFADGAAACDPLVLALSILWLTAMCAVPLALVLVPASLRLLFFLLYLCFALQIFWAARQLGTYRMLTCALYPLPLVFYFALFAKSLFHRTFKLKVNWRGRTL